LPPGPLVLDLAYLALERLRRIHVEWKTLFGGNIV
jgi:hypothetical protein